MGSQNEVLLEAQEQDQGAQSQLEFSPAQSAEDSSRKVIGNDRPTADHSKDNDHEDEICRRQLCHPGNWQPVLRGFGANAFFPSNIG